MSQQENSGRYSRLDYRKLSLLLPGGEKVPLRKLQTRFLDIDLLV